MNSTQSSDPTGPTGQLCAFIHDTQLSNIPPEIVERAKYLILDGVACSVVASHLPWSETAATAIFKMESGGQCTVIGWGDRRLPPLAATILNSTFIQGFELDDYHSNAPLHSNSLLIPPLLAATEAKQDHANVVSGVDFLKAYVIGCEVGPRVGLALHGADLLSRGWHSGAVQGPSASAAAVSSLLGLTPAQIEWALGIACTQAGGLMSAQFGSMAKRMQHGFGARNGLFAALMAKEGYTGIEQVYETPYGGFLSCFGQGATFEPKTLPDELSKGLGSRWEINNIRVKLHAAMAALHGTIECIEELQADHPNLFENGSLENIEKVTTEHSKPAFEHGGWEAPAEKPISSTGAQMSIQYAAAAQLIDRQVLMEQFGAAKLNRPEIRSLMSKIRPKYNEALDEERWATIVTVRFRDGKEVEVSLAAPRNVSPGVTNEEVVDKWRRLVSGVLDDRRRDEIERCVLGLENEADVTKLGALLQGTVKCPIDV